MISVKAGVEATGVGVSGLGLPAVSMVSVKNGVEAAGVGVSGLMVTCGCL